MSPRISHHLKTAVTALAIGVVLLAALDWAATAATGKPLLLGRWNEAGHATTLKSTQKGQPALKLKANGGPALAINNTKLVKNLNADKLDGFNAEAFKKNRNRIYQWSVPTHTGGFSQPIPDQAPGSYLAAYSAQLVGAAGDQANPNTISCRIVVSALSGTLVTDKAVVGETTMTSVGTPPALSGTGAVILGAGDHVRFDCSMTRNAQKWSTAAIQPIQVSFLRVDGSDVYGGVLAKPLTLKRSTDR